METLCKDAKAVFHWSGKSIALEKVLPLPTPLGREAGEDPAETARMTRGHSTPTLGCLVYWVIKISSKQSHTSVVHEERPTYFLRGVVMCCKVCIEET